ncbi:hypothetical protein [Vreelandella sp. GE22]
MSRSSSIAIPSPGDNPVVVSQSAVREVTAHLKAKGLIETESAALAARHQRVGDIARIDKKAQALRALFRKGKQGPQEHDAIVSAIQGREEAGARYAMQRHIKA